MLSVGIVTYSTKPRGSVVHAVCLAEALHARGIDVTVYALSKTGDDFYRPLRCRAQLLPAAVASADPEQLIRQRVAELEQGLSALGARHDIWHAEDCLSASALLANAATFRPIARTVHHVERFENPFLAACQRRSVLDADLLLSVSRFTAREVRDTFGRDSRVIHNGVALERFDGARPAGDRDAADPERAASSHAESALAIAKEERVVLSVGGVEQRKNSLRCLDAVLPLLASDARLRWVVVGGDSIWDHSEYRREFASRLARAHFDVQRRVQCIGPVPEDTLSSLYRRCQVFLGPSLHEGWGLAALEAMAAGRVVIASAGEPFTEFADAGSALLVDPTSTTAIRTALATALSDSELRARLGAAARGRAERFTWRRTALEHEDAYRGLLARCATERVSLGAAAP